MQWAPIPRTAPRFPGAHRKPAGCPQAILATKGHQGGTTGPAASLPTKIVDGDSLKGGEVLLVKPSWTATRELSSVLAGLRSPLAPILLTRGRTGGSTLFCMWTVDAVECSRCHRFCEN